MKRKQFIAVIALAIYVSFANAKAPIKFGKVSLEELQMTTYDADTSATAVMLCKFGEFNAEEFTFTETRRVKILKKAGTEHSEFTFPGDQKTNVKCKVFNLENGEIVEEKMSKESIFKVKVTEDIYQIKVAIPNVKVGTVYDIQIFYNYLPPEFAFQEEIPVEHSELILEKSTYVEYRKRSTGYIHVNSENDRRFWCDNVEAFKSEPYINSSENYKSKFEFDLLNISYPGFYRSYTTSWDAVNDRLAASSYFGHAIFNGSAYLNQTKKEIEATCTTREEKARAAIAAIKKVKWNEYETIYTSTESLSSIYKEGKANSAEINLMLMQLLMKLDLPALPVVLSTRDNGVLNPFYPTLEKLNYVVIRTLIDDKEVLIDATDELLPLGMLPKRCLNGQGRLVTNEAGTWVNLRTDKADKESVLYDLTLTDDLKLEGQISLAKYDYAAYKFRKDYKEYASEEDYLTYLETSNPGLIIQDYSFKNIDNIYEPINEKYTVKMSNQIQNVNGMLLINPFFFDQIKENPFKLDNRQYPIDFAYTQSKMIITKITIPEGYQIETLPQPIRAVMPDKKSSILISYGIIGNSVSVSYKFILDKAVYSAEEYPLLKALYAEVVKKQAEPIILKPIRDEASL